MQPTQTDLAGKALQALKFNDLGSWTRPAIGLYPYQWLWDSCFIAIGLRHVDINRAQEEIRSLLKGQWQNGMVPHMIFTEKGGNIPGFEQWESHRHPEAPKDFATSAITQPPMIAEAVVKVSRNMNDADRLAWFRETYPAIVRFHEWLYRERDPDGIGAVFLIHAWESGLDDTPPWMDICRPFVPLKVRLANVLHLGKLLDWGRKDIKIVDKKQRTRSDEFYTLFKLQDELRERDYDLTRIKNSRIPLVLDIVFNSILVRANENLRYMAREIGEAISPELDAKMQNSAAGLQELLADDGNFYSRDYRTGQLIAQPSIGSLMPLYSGSVTDSQAAKIVEQIKNTTTFWTEYPIPTTPVNSHYFSPVRYWQGPVWLNMNWFIIDGLRRYRYHDLANELTQKTLKMVEHAGMYEYFSPLDGRGAGAVPFSWTAALTLDLLDQTHRS